MIDRIASPWGERTPFGRDEVWPVRVDQFLEDSVDEEDVDAWVQTASILHSNGDALDIAVKDGRIAGVRGRGVDRVNKGRLGPKDLFGWQANNSEDRLKKPLVRRNGELVEAGWDEAFDRIVGKSKRLLEEKGPLAFGFYTTGQLFLEEYYTLGVIGKAGLGTPHMDGNTRLCTATAGQALKETFGSDGQPGSYADINHADAIMLFGHNMAETQAVTWMRILDRLEGPNPPELVVVDPRPTPVAERATVHLAIKTGTNVALLNAFLYEIVHNGWYDREYVDAHTLGFEELKSTGTREGGIGLIRDLHDLYLMANACDIAWTMIGQAAQGAGDTELLDVVNSCEGQTATQIKWLKTRMKQAAPQALLVAP